MTPPLHERVALITGASRGIGRATARALAAAGADLVLTARTETDLRAAADEVEALGRRALVVPADASQADDVARLEAAAIGAFGRVDILVNNAGTNPFFGAVQDMDERAWDAIMNTNVKAAFFLSVMAREAMLEHGEGGSIVNVSSIGGLQASDVIGGYSISKAAMIMLTQVCAKTWGRDDIRVNCIAPGLIKTEFSRALWENEAILEDATQTAALRRIGTPEEMAGAVVYLSSRAASFVTGQTLVLCGGRWL